MQRGFSLIEILVVIAIIGVMSTIAFVSYEAVRLNTRTVVRAHDLKTLQQVVDMYYAAHGVYPNTGNAYWYDCYPSPTHYADYVPNVVAAGLLPALPHDPGSRCGGNRDFNYAYKSDGKTYVVMLQVPNVNGFENCSAGSKYGFTIDCGNDPYWASGR